MRHLSLFSGIGGLDLAAEWAGFETVGQCEFADYPTKILEKHWPNVPRWRDVRDVTAESVREKCGTVDIISGGFPCQPFSVAGKQKGKGDERYLWPEMLRVIREIKPTWVLGENVPGILRIAADEVCQDLEREGYEVGIFNFEAAAVGAKHRRERIFFLGYSKHDGFSVIEKLRSNETSSHNWGQEEQKKAGESQGADRSVDEHGIYRSQFGSEQCAEGMLGGRSREKSFADVANADMQGQSPRGCEKPAGREVAGRHSDVPDANNGRRIMWRNRKFPAAPQVEGCGSNNRGRTPQYVAGEWWAVEPDVGRVANGVSSRVDRLRSLGNAVVPQQAYPIFKAIADIEKGLSLF